MAVQQFTFPQSGDADDAEHFAAMIGQANLSNFVETGLTFTYDSTVPEVSVAQGKGFISLSSDVASSSGEDILAVNHVVQVPGQTVALTDAATNYIYLEPNFGTDDNGDVSAYTSTQGGNVLLIGVIDTSADTVETRNREPAIDSRSIGLEDDATLDFGDGDDFQWYYDSSQDRLALDNDAGTRLADVGDTNWQMEVSLDLQGNRLDNVAFIDNDGTKIQFDDSIDLTGQGVLYDTNFGTQELVDGAVDSSSAGGTEHSYDFSIDNTPILQIYAESDGAGGIQNAAVDALSDLDLNANNIDNVSTVDGGGTTITFADAIDVPADSLDATEVDIARGLEDDGTGAIQFDEDTTYTFTVQQTFNAGVRLGDATTVTYPTNAGAETLVDMSVDGNAAAGTEESYGLSLDATELFQVYAESDGAGGIQNTQVDVLAELDVNSNNVANLSTLDGGGTAITFNDAVNVPADSFDATEVDIARGLEDDGTGAIQFDEDTAYTFTAQQTFNAGVRLGSATSVTYPANSGAETLANMAVDGNAAAGTEESYGLYIDSTELLEIYAESDGAGAIQNAQVNLSAELDANSNNITNLSTLDGGGTAITFNDTVDVPADSFDATEVDIGRGLEGDGTGSIQFDEDTAYTFTTSQQFNSGIDLNQTQANRFVIENRTTDPTAVVGQLWYRTDLD